MATSRSFSATHKGKEGKAWYDTKEKSWMHCAKNGKPKKVNGAELQLVNRVSEEIDNG